MYTLILGFGLTGRDLANYLYQKKMPFIVVDKNPKTKKAFVFPNHDALFCDEKAEIAWKRIQQVIVSPGVLPTHPHIEEAKRRNIPVDTEVSFIGPKVNAIAIGVTGTNGKTTTCTALKTIFSAETSCYTVGNIGKTLISTYGKVDKEDLLIIELSSFQLQWVASPFLDVALWTNLQIDHLDHHKNMLEYAEAKANMQKALKKEGIFYVPEEVVEQYPKLFWFPRIVTFKQGKDPFIYARLIAKEFGIEEYEIKKRLMHFSFPKYRLQLLGTICGIDVYNDSKSTNPASTSYALEQMQKAVCLIAGGKDKGGEFAEWNRFSSKIKKIFLIGEAAEKIAKQLIDIPYEFAATLEEATEKAFRTSKKNEIVLLSPGCASYDMFKDYKERGLSFYKAVQKIKSSEE